MASYLVTGTNRGLGLALIKQLATSPPSPVSHIFATARTPQPSADLQALVAAHPQQIHYVTLDIGSESSIAAAASSVASILGPQAGLDVLINSAGQQWQEPGGIKGMMRLAETINANVIAIHHTILGFLPLLQKSTQKKIVNISSTLGSVAKAEMYKLAGSVPSYKISKTTLNMLTAQWAMELGAEGFKVVAVCPGRLNTGLGGIDNNDADLSADDGAEEVLRIVESLDAKDNGTFRNIFVQGSEIYRGQVIPW